jgi:hypothetical protein
MFTTKYKMNATPAPPKNQIRTGGAWMRLEFRETVGVEYVTPFLELLFIRYLV